MVTIKQLVEEQKYNKMNDICLIKTFFETNNMEEEGIELMYELTKSKLKKLKMRVRISEEWTSSLPSKYLYEKYDLNTADMLHTLELEFISYGYKLKEHSLKWAKENIPNIEMPQIYFQPLMEYLEENEIKFKDEK